MAGIECRRPGANQSDDESPDDRDDRKQEVDEMAAGHSLIKRVLFARRPVNLIVSWERTADEGFPY